MDPGLRQWAQPEKMQGNKHLCVRVTCVVDNHRASEWQNASHVYPMQSMTGCRAQLRDSDNTATEDSHDFATFFLHETFAHGAVRYAMRQENRNENKSRTRNGKRSMHHPRCDRRVIMSLGEKERGGPNERTVAV